jgi:hypothetical protein
MADEEVIKRMTPAEYLRLRKADWILRRAGHARAASKNCVTEKGRVLASLIADALESAAAIEVREMTLEALGRYLRRTAGEPNPPHEPYEMLCEAYGLQSLSLRGTSVDTKLGGA